MPTDFQVAIEYGMDYRKAYELYLCDNGCYHCADVSNDGTQHRYVLDDGNEMYVTEYKDAYNVQVFSSDGGNNYYVPKESWRLMIAEEAYQDCEFRSMLGIY